MNETAVPFERILTTDEKAALRGVVFRDRTLEGFDLAGADLRGAQFHHVCLLDCSLSGADLRGAAFTLCDLRGVVLTGALVDESRFDGSTLDDRVVIEAEGRAHIERAGGTFIHRQASQR